MRVAISTILCLLILVPGCFSTPSSSPHVTTKDENKKSEVDAGGEAIDRLLDLMGQRLRIMHEVARCKWHAQLPISDPKREQELLTKVMELGRDLGLESGSVQKFFRAQILAGKMVQQADFEHWQKTAKSPPAGGPDLQALRADIDALNRKLLDALVAINSQRKQPGWQSALQRRIPVLLRGEGITEEIRQAACSPLLSP